MEHERSEQGGFSGIAVTAALAIIVLVAVLAWKAYTAIQTRGASLSVTIPPSTAPEEDANDTIVAMASTTTTIQSSTGDASSSIMDTLVGSYFFMKQNGTYTPQAGATLGDAVASSLHADLSYETFSAVDIETSPDTSFARAALYQKEFESALAPLKQKTEPEYVTFASYVETRDRTYLDKLRERAGLYAQAASNSVRIIVPVDAVSVHLAVVNSFEEFGAALNALANFADDPIASVSVLPAYNAAESHASEALNALNLYYANKHR